MWLARCPFHDWQYLSVRVAAKTAYTSLRILLVYECNVITPIVHPSRSRPLPNKPKKRTSCCGRRALLLL